MKRNILLSLLVGMMGVIALGGCEKFEHIVPNKEQQQATRNTEVDGCVAGIVEPVILDEYTTDKLDSLFSRNNNTFPENDNFGISYEQEELFAPIFKVIRNNDEFLEIGGDFDFEFDKYCIVGGRIWGGSSNAKITFKEMNIHEDCSCIYVVRRFYPANDYCSFPPVYFWEVFPKGCIINNPELIIEDEYENE
ncbi:MAG: hypothetical protein II815_04380 [Bacteroidales bacterium]|nr:hypothetical protein [Bacteroidales bacterium]